MMTAVATLIISVGTSGVSDAQILPLFNRPPPPPQQSPPPPPGPGPSSGGRHIVYSVSAQRVWLYEGQNVVSNYAVSGRRGVPRPGTYQVFSKSPWASNGKVRMQWMVRFVPGGKAGLATGFHAIPVTRSGQPIQSEAELGSYRSHGCVRQRNADAEFLYHWAPMRARVVVHG